MKRAAFSVLALLAGGCGAGPSQIDAYVLPAGNGLTSKSQISICYSSTLDTPQEIQALVARDCEEPKLTGNERNLGVCPLATPILVTYSCKHVNPDLLGQRATMPLRPLKN
jgi:hypothetical protein